MADLYYHIEGLTCYFRNSQDMFGDYTLWTSGMKVCENKNIHLWVATDDDTFVFPDYCNDLFYGASMSSLYLPKKIDTSNIRLATEMFMNCDQLTDSSFIEKFDFSKMESCSRMFKGCTRLTNMDFSNKNFSRVFSVEEMFSGCTSLETISFNNTDSTFSPDNMIGMFKGCSSLKNIEGYSNWYVTYVTTFKSMFEGCSSLTSLDFSGWNFKFEAYDYGSYSVDYMFKDCTSLASIKTRTCSDWSKYSSCYGRYTFENCTSLPNWDGTTDITKANDSTSGYFYNEIEIWYLNPNWTSEGDAPWKGAPREIYFANKSLAPLYRRYYRNSQQDGFWGTNTNIIIELGNIKFILLHDGKRLFFMANNIYNLDIVDTSICEDFSYMFNLAAHTLTAPVEGVRYDLSTWTDFGRAKKLDNMFYNAGVNVLVKENTDWQTLIPEGCTSANMFGSDEDMGVAWPDYDRNVVDITKANNIDGYFELAHGYYYNTEVYEKNNGAWTKADIYQKNGLWKKSDAIIKF